MADVADREFLTSVFLVEAWDTVTAVEDALARLDQEPVKAATVLETLLVVTHRLRGSAALHGFPRTAELAAAMEELAERARTASSPALAGPVGELLASLKRSLDRIARGAGEDPQDIGAALARLAAGEPADETARLLGELDRFWAENPEVVAYFGPEAAEHLDAMTEALLAVQRAGADDGALTRLYRAVHTLKGAAYTVGCRPLGLLAHRVEDLLDAVSEGRRPLSASVLDALFAGLDALRALVDSAGRAVPGRRAAVERARSLLDAALAERALAVRPAGERASPRLPSTPAASVATSPAPASPAPASPPPSVRVELGRLDSMMGLVAELVVTRSRLERRLDELERLAGLVAAGRGRIARIARGIEGRPGDPRPAAAGPPAAWPLEPAPAPDGSGDPRFAELEFDRYHELDLVSRALAEVAGDAGEIGAELSSLAGGVRSELERIGRLTAALRREVTRTRMVPIERLFARLGRQVREAARAAGKPVLFQTRGDTLEIDGRVAEQLADPLLHLLLNAVVHGIEPPAERRAAGKAEPGTVQLTVARWGAALHVEVADDGRGIDAERVRREAVARGLVDPDTAARLDARGVLDLVFLPRLSTATEVSATAGRGIGMEIVRAAVSRLGGALELESVPGRGTRVRIRLPLTVAIAEVVLVRAGPEIFAVPLAAVGGLRRVASAETRAAGAAPTIEVEGRAIALLHLAHVLGLAAPAAGPRPVLVLQTGRATVGVAVEELLGKEEVVVRRLGAFLQGLGPYGGATTTGDGRVILLLDPERLAEAGAGRSAERPPAPGRDAPAEAGAPRVLLVDDSLSVRKVVGRMVERAGFRVVTATDGAEALERLAEGPVDLVITDLEMPRLDGYELIRHLRRRPATRTTAVVVLTTRAGAKHAALARELGVAGYVTKPVDEPLMTRLLRGLTASAGAAGDR